MELKDNLYFGEQAIPGQLLLGSTATATVQNTPFSQPRVHTVAKKGEKKSMSKWKDGHGQGEDALGLFQPEMPDLILCLGVSVLSPLIQGLS